MLIGLTRKLAPATGGWTPALLSPKLWLKADAGVTEVAGAVSNWASQEGLGYNFAQATGANKPTYSATGFNTSYPGLTFAFGAPSFVSSSAFILNCPHTMSVYVVMSRTAASEDNGGVLSFKSNGQADDYNAPSFIIETINATAKVEMYSSGARGNPTSDIIIANNTAVALGWIIEFDVPGFFATMYKNNVPTAVPDAAAVAIGSASAAVLAIGSRPWNGNTPSFDGTIAEIVITDTALGTTDRGLLQAYFAAKWGI